MRRVFIPFVIEDEDAIKGLRLLAINPGYTDLEFYDESVRVLIDSIHAPYIRSRIKDKIGRCGVVLCAFYVWISGSLNSHLAGAKAVG